MSYQEKSILASLITNLLIFGFYFIKVFQMYQAGSLNSKNVFTLWAYIIVVAIIVNIIVQIITHIVLHILDKGVTCEEVDPSFTDERDKFIQLKATRNSYYVLMTGVALSMIAMGFGMQPLMMFNLLGFSLLVGEIIGYSSQLYFYRRGF